MSKNWNHITTIIDGEAFTISGLNIWNYEWKRTGESINIQDPLYGQNYTMPVYEISDRGTVVRFAAGEFSNCIWGIYQQNG